MTQGSSRNEQGLTLVEVLAALVILGILFIGIMTIFPQMTLFNTQTATKLDTMNLARQEMVTVADKTGDLLNGAGPAGLPNQLDGINYSKVPSLSPDYVTYEKVQDGYLYRVNFFIDSDLAANPVYEDTKNIQLYKVHLQIFSKGKLSSETYSYVTYTSGSSGG